MYGLNRSVYASAYDDAAQYYGQQNPYAQHLGLGDDGHLEGEEEFMLRSESQRSLDRTASGLSGVLASGSSHRRLRSSSHDEGDDSEGANSRITLSAGQSRGRRLQGGVGSEGTDGLSDSGMFSEDESHDQELSAERTCWSIGACFRRFYLTYFPAPCDLQRSIIFNDGAFGIDSSDTQFSGTYRGTTKLRNSSLADNLLTDDAGSSHLISSARSVSLAAELNEPVSGGFAAFRTRDQVAGNRQHGAVGASGVSAAGLESRILMSSPGQRTGSHQNLATGLWSASPAFKTPENSIRVAPEDVFFPSNAVNNQKYSLISFVPLFLYFEFRFFFNLYFLVVALTQLVPALQVGFLFTYVAPLCVVMSVSMAKEAYDDIQRHRRDRVVNNELYLRLVGDSTAPPGVEDFFEDGARCQRVRARDLRVGDLIVLHANQRVPSDCVLLRTLDKQGTCFIRTDQLDGETDWKSRRAVMATQRLASAALLLRIHAELNIESPKLDIYDFAGNFKYYGLEASVKSMPEATSPRSPIVDEAATVAPSATHFGAAIDDTTDLNRLGSNLSESSQSTAYSIQNQGSSVSASGVPERFDNSLPAVVEPIATGESNEDVTVEPLTLENTLWASTVVASGTVVACVVYTGLDTRASRNASLPKTKTGLLDEEVNNLSKLLFLITMLLAFTMTLLKGLTGEWYIYLFRFVLLLSSIIPISLRVNLDLGKTFYSLQMMRDEKIPETVVRTSTIPEELGRLSYLFSDKTGTLTCNVMVFKSLVLGPMLTFTQDRLGELAPLLRLATWTLGEVPTTSTAETLKQGAATAGPTTVPVSPSAQKVGAMLLAIALCHNVTPVVPEPPHDHEHAGEDTKMVLSSTNEDTATEYQASSPDEVALVKFSESVGLKLIERTQTSITLRTPRGHIATFEVLSVFPFASETKRMGIIVREKLRIFDNTGDSITTSTAQPSNSEAALTSSVQTRIVFYLKGAEAVMKPRCLHCEWVDEELSAMASAGLRTLVYARRVLTENEYAAFASQLTAARSALEGRSEAVQATMALIERDLELLGITGVDDRLQPGVAECLERLRDASIRTWMLTGDKAETAACIGRSARLVAPTQRIFPVSTSSEDDLFMQLNHFSGLRDACLLIDGPTLQLAMDRMPRLFLKTACRAPSVICCRCSPTQKAKVVTAMKEHTGTRVCAIGDGGNDVAMIQAADVGVGIMGLEGRQAAMAADFSITQFSHLERLVLWHGRNSYKRSARLAQFVMHRGLIISIIQAVFSALFFFVAVPIYNGWLMVGYTTIYTMLPVFSLVLDQDIDEEAASLYPQLYTELQKGRPLSFKTFFMWLFLSVYQGGLIMILAIALFESSIVNIVSITFTALVLCELVNVALSIHRWTKLMVAAEIISAVSYFISILVLRSYFDLTFVFTLNFAWKTLAVTAACTLPPAIFTRIAEAINPAKHSKVRNIGTMQRMNQIVMDRRGSLLPASTGPTRAGRVGGSL